MFEKKRVSELENKLSQLLERQSKYPKVKLEGLYINHKSFGKGLILEEKNGILIIKFGEAIKKMGMAICINKKLITFENNIITEAVYYEEEIKTIRKELTELKKTRFYSNIKSDSKKMNAENLTITLDEKAFSKLDEEQKKVYNALKDTDNNYFITGKAGTGKSYVLNLFRKTTNKRILVLAPTGIAARNVQGVTIHSAFGFDNLVKISIEDLSSETIKLSREKEAVLKAVDTIIIDEVSMVSADVFEKMNKILKIINQNDNMFGGKQVVIVGDIFQLPPVVKEDAEREYLLNTYGGIHFFNSNAYKNSSFNFVELTINHRQKSDAQFFEILNNIRMGFLNKHDIDILNSRRLLTDDIYDRYITIVPKRWMAEKINTERISNLGLPEYTYEAKVVYGKKENEQSWENKFPVNEKLILRRGANIMMTYNDPNKRWVNGTLGIVAGLNDNSINVAIEGRLYKVEPTKFEQKKAIYKNGRIEYVDDLVIEQYPILPAYAITTHKSQGQTYKDVMCDVQGSFAAGQVYVALSRCTSLDGLHLRNYIEEKNVFVDKTVMKFYQEQINILKPTNN